METVSLATEETIEMVKKGFGVDEIFPVHPNLVLSTDNTTLFVFEGNAHGVGEEDGWEWKVVDTATTNSLIRSDFEAGEEGGNSRGL